MKLASIPKSFIEQNNVPKVAIPPKTFLGISGQPHYENVVSNIYAFYFDPNEEHNLGTLWIDSLNSLICREAPQWKPFCEGFTGFEVFREYYTVGNGFIDLVFKNDESAILIENKVYHDLENDLHDYWISVNVEGGAKVGIVLSLHPVPNILHSDFINITHRQLLQKVKKGLKEYKGAANHKYIVFLEDLIQNMKNLTHRIMRKEEMQYFLEHQESILNVVEFQQSVQEHIKKDVEAVGLGRDGVFVRNLKNNSDIERRLRYFVSKKYEDLMFTIVFDGLYNSSRKMVLIVELRGRALFDKQRYESIQLEVDEKKILAHDFKAKKGSWAHFARKEYTLSDADMIELSEFIRRKLKEDHFVSVFEKLEVFLTKDDNKVVS